MTNYNSKSYCVCLVCFFFFSSRRRHTRYWRDWSSDVCSSDLRQAVTRAIADKGRTIRVPVHMVEKINKYYRVQRSLAAKLNRDPDDEIGRASCRERV